MARTNYVFQGNITFIFDILPENVITSKYGCFLRQKILLI